MSCGQHPQQAPGCISNCLGARAWVELMRMLAMHFMALVATAVMAEGAH